MSDFINPDSKDEELEKILSEVRGAETGSDDKPSKEWSLDDIDRLIAEESGGEFTPAEKKESAAERLEKMLAGSEFDEGMFTLKTDTDEEPEEEIPEPTDIFSGSEVAGQEMFFEDEGDGFDPFSFEMETVVMPDDVPEPVEIKYSNHTEKPEPLPPTIGDKE